jgi:hypothetical protein
MGFLLFVVWFVSSLVFLACIGSYLPDKKGKQTKPLPAFVFVVSAIISTGCFIHWVVGANSADEARVAAHEANESRHAADPAPPDPTDAATDAPLPGPGDDATVSTGSNDPLYCFTDEKDWDALTAAAANHDDEGFGIILSRRTDIDKGSRIHLINHDPFKSDYDIRLLDSGTECFMPESVHPKFRDVLHHDD